MADSNPVFLTDSEVLVHTAPLPGKAKVLVFVEFNHQVTHVISLAAEAARTLVLGLLEALDIAAPAEAPDDLSALQEPDGDDGEQGA